jgi:hypothetical protein
MARKLDRTRHYDQSYGETNLRFYQDKRWFNNLGEEVDLDGRVIPDPVAASPVPATAPPPPPVSLPTPGTDPADEDAGPGVSVDEALNTPRPRRCAADYERAFATRARAAQRRRPSPRWSPSASRSGA